MTSHLSDANLLLWLDGGLRPDAVRDGRAHLAACQACRERWQVLSAVDGRVRELELEGSWVTDIRHDRERTRLAQRLTDDRPRVQWWARLDAQIGRPLGVAAALLLLALATLTLLNVPGRSTPGATDVA
ncbi:MAG: hypothetical protein ABL982_13545, partial [Vicinamibacterales bacterium]